MHGHAAPGFEGARALLARALARPGELGAAVAAWRGDEPLVDLWGGWRDRARREPWTRDTRALLFSVTKGVAALALARRAEAGELDPDAPVADLWPDFARGGKGALTVRELLGHRAGLLRPPGRLDPATLRDAGRTAELLARCRPAWEPGARHGYHVLSFGFYAGELARRADPRGRSLGTQVRDDLAAPLGGELRIGGAGPAPAELAPLRPRDLLAAPAGFPLGMLARLPFPWSRVRRALANPRLRGFGELARPEWLEVELASANGVGTARALARLYAAFAGPSAALPVSRATRDALAAVPAPPPGGALDLVVRAETSYSLGLFRPTRRFPFGTDARAFGMAGAGGAFAFADPATGVGYAFVANRMGARLFDDPREKPLRDLVLAAAAERGAAPAAHPC